jgi:ATP-dependent 26S proteasome regulatory subunit
LLLHGPPGVGKTLTAMYLATRMPDRTVVLLTVQGVGSLSASVDLATALQPAMVILEDVDLVAMERSFQPTNAILFELLNAMDGLDEDHDVLFVLTTNRADVLEPALAARPGRIDQAVELPLPDASARRRLLELYGRGLDLTPSTSCEGRPAISPRRCSVPARPRLRARSTGPTRTADLRTGPPARAGRGSPGRRGGRR